MESMKQIYLLLICQGFYLASLCQEWTFPTRVKALIGSCVEIPCTYHPPGTSDTYGTVWYLYRHLSTDPEILNTKDLSPITPKYKDRTSLVPGNNSCALRIDRVGREDDGKYYPGITGDISVNAYKIHSRYVYLDVSDKVNIQIYGSGPLKEGEATAIRCSADHTCPSSPPSLHWNKPGQVINQSVEISGGSWREESELTYIPTYVDDGSRVQCTATYPNDLFAQTSAILSINYSPKNVTITIIGTNEVIEGSDVTLQCNSFSKPDVHEYEWYKGKTRLPDRGREMTVYNVPGDMEPYSCTAINRVGRGESAPAEIPVLYAPKNVTIVIGKNEVREGSDVTLQCNSFSKPDVHEYEWYKGKTRLPDRGREITVYNVTGDMEPYSCTAINPVGRGESAPTEIPVLCFYLGSVCQEWMFPSRVKALIGSCVEVPCTYHPSGTPDTSSTVWYLYRNLLSDQEILNTKDLSSTTRRYKGRTSLVPGKKSCTLRIDPVTRGDNGIYYPGIAEDKDINAYEKHSRYVYLDVSDKVNIQIYASGALTDGEAATIRCSVDHTCRSSPPSLQWNKPGQVKNQSVEISEGSWREESELIYIPSYVDDGSRVQCTAVYPSGQRVERSGILYINYSPKNVTITGMDEVVEGSDVTLQCNSFSKPDVNEYEWYKGRTRLPDRGREMTVYNVPGDMEPYSCTAINRVGRGESATAEIPVIYAPQNVTLIIIGMDEVMEGSDVMLQCISFSKPDVHEYEWYKGKTRLPDRGREMTVYNVPGDMEPYSCTAINRVGRGESAPAQIPVLYKGSSISNIILPTTGALCLLLLVSLVYYYWRKRGQKWTSNETEASPDAIYADLVRTDIENDQVQSQPVAVQPENSTDITIAGGHLGADSNYVNAKTSPEATYADLVSGDTGHVYEQLKAETSPDDASDDTYIDLVGGDIEKNYKQAEISPDASCSDVGRGDIEKEYERLKPENSADIAITGHVEAESNYVNPQEKNQT